MLPVMNTTDTPAPTLSAERLRLRVQADALLNAFEAAPAPETYADILKATRTLMAIDRMLVQMARHEAKEVAEVAAQETDIPAASSRPDEPALAPALAPVNRKQRRILAALQRKAFGPDDIFEASDTRHAAPS